MAGRPLILIPIIHAEIDMGNLRGKLPFTEIQEGATIAYFQKVFDYFKSWSLDFSKLKVYQDSLPNYVPEKVERIVAETQSENYEVLRWLKNQGASIIGTEGPALLEEYQSLQTIAKAGDESSRQTALLEHRRKAPQLLRDRDEYIARRINSTLCTGEIGLLFQGALHYAKGSVSLYLDKDVRVSRPAVLERALLEVILEVERELTPPNISKERIQL